jgi:hypothetical protein
MEATIAKQTYPQVQPEYRCTVCGAWLRWEDLCCETHADAGLGPRQYVELFWEEA